MFLWLMATSKSSDNRVRCTTPFYRSHRVYQWAKLCLRRSKISQVGAKYVLKFAVLEQKGFSRLY